MLRTINSMFFPHNLPLWKLEKAFSTYNVNESTTGLQENRMHHSSKRSVIHYISIPELITRTRLESNYLVTIRHSLSHEGISLAIQLAFHMKESLWPSSTFNMKEFHMKESQWPFSTFNMKESHWPSSYRISHPSVFATIYFFPSPEVQLLPFQVPQKEFLLPFYFSKDSVG